MDNLCSYVDEVMVDRDQYFSAEDDAQDRETALEQEVSFLKDQVKRISAEGQLELEVVKVQRAHEDTVVILNLQMQESQRLRKEIKQKVEELERAVEEAE